MSNFNFKTFVKKNISNNLKEGGYFGQGTSTNGAISFHGTYYGFGGDKQLAAEPVAAVKKLKKQRDKEATHNIEKQMKINRGYPASQSTSGFPGGESGAGINSGKRIPNNVSKFITDPEELSNILDIDNPTKQYWGFNKSKEKRDLEEQLGGTGQGAVRGAASDQNYRDGQGFPRHNTIEKSVDYVPKLEGDKDGDGEEDVYLTDEEYVNDVLRLNGLSVKINEIYGETEKYKQGKLVRDHEPDSTKKLIKHVDYSGGHTTIDSAKNSPGGQTYGNVAFPKNFVPEDWEQRNSKNKKTMELDEIRKVIKTITKEVIEEKFNSRKKKTKKKAYTGIYDETGKGSSKGGSNTFEKNQKEIINQDMKERNKKEK